MNTGASTIVLYKGSHEPPAEGCDNPQRCLFEAYNWLTRQDHTDSRPPGVGPVLYHLGLRLNDRLSDTKRQQLVFALPNGEDPLAGTEHDGLDETRMLMAANWAIHTGARTWLREAGLTDDEAALAALPPITSLAALAAARPALRDIRDRLRAKRSTLYADLRAKIRAKLAEPKPAAAAAAAAVADAAAAAAAAAVAVAVAVAAADAAAVAAAAADAAAVAAAAAAAAAVADAAADAAADAVADAAADWRTTYNQAYKAAYAAAKQAIDAKHGPTIAAIEDSAIALYKAMIRPQAA